MKSKVFAGRFSLEEAAKIDLLAKEKGVRKTELIHEAVMKKLEGESKLSGESKPSKSSDKTQARIAEIKGILKDPDGSSDIISLKEELAELEHPKASKKGKPDPDSEEKQTARVLETARLIQRVKDVRADLDDDDMRRTLDSLVAGLQAEFDGREKPDKTKNDRLKEAARIICGNVEDLQALEGIEESEQAKRIEENLSEEIKVELESVTELLGNEFSDESSDEIPDGHETSDESSAEDKTKENLLDGTILPIDWFLRKK